MQKEDRWPDFTPPLRRDYRAVTVADFCTAALIEKERNEMTKYAASVRADGLRVHIAKYDQYLERPDGQFARCHPGGSPSQPWLYCMAKEKLPGSLMLAYDFRTTEAIFMQKSETIAANARAIFNSVIQH
jgi:hypothetical protein